MISVTASSFILIFLAEMGDKSQLVCMLLAGRHRGLPVFLGAVAAFALLNALAVMFGATLAQFIPHHIIAALVVLLFIGFGVKTLLEANQPEEEVAAQAGRSIFFSAFSMVFLAELGDKTQITVAALGAQSQPLAVYIGATLALVATSWLGVVGGRWLTNKLSPRRMKQIAGVIFLGFAGWIAVANFVA